MTTLTQRLADILVPIVLNVREWAASVPARADTRAASRLGGDDDV